MHDRAANRVTVKNDFKKTGFTTLFHMIPVGKVHASLGGKPKSVIY